MRNLYNNFPTAFVPPLRRYLVGNAALEPAADGLRLVRNATTHRAYSDAQIDNFAGGPRSAFLARPPLRLTLRARFSHPAHELIGTAGFGFWNYPHLVSRQHLPVLPRAIWYFFASPPSDMKLDLQTPGYGWKAATIDALRPDALAMALPGPLAMALMNLPPLYRALWPPIQRALGVREAPLTIDMTTWHIYTIEWGLQHARFLIDGHPVLENAPAPRGPLCFIMWIDNQYAIARPWGHFRWGLLAAPGRQWLEVGWLAIEQRDGGPAR